VGKSNGSDGGHRKPPSLSDDEIAAILSIQSRIPTIKLEDYEIAPEIIALVPRLVCEQHRLLPVSRAGHALIVAMVDPFDLEAHEALRAHTTMNIEPVIAEHAALVEAIKRLYGKG
jgi:type IV pilus assembly protein PilB